MQSRVPSILAAIVLVAILGFYMCTFQVRVTEVAVRKTFGKADAQAISSPGLYAKWPWPVQEVVKYDTRIRMLEDTVEETPTSDSKNVTITTFTGWSIVDPYKFHTSYPDPSQAEEALRTKVRAHKKAVVGRHAFSEFVSTEPQERKLRDIEAEMKELVAAEARAGFGVEIKLFGIKRLGLPSEVTKEIFSAMKKEQENKAANYEAEGKAQAQDIVARAQAQRSRIMSVAQRKVDDIRGDGLRRVGEIYQRFAEHPELQIFIDKLRALEEILKTRTTLLLDTRFVPVDLFDEGSRLEPGELELELPPMRGPAETSEPKSPSAEPRPSASDDASVSDPPQTSDAPGAEKGEPQ